MRRTPRCYTRFDGLASGDRTARIDRIAPPRSVVARQAGDGMARRCRRCIDPRHICSAPTEWCRRSAAVRCALEQRVEAVVEHDSHAAERIAGRRQRAPAFHRGQIDARGLHRKCRPRPNWPVPRQPQRASCNQTGRAGDPLRGGSGRHRSGFG